MSNLVISVLRLPPELFWDDDPATRHRHETFRRLAADRVEYLEAQVEACSSRNSSDVDRVAELEREAALSRDLAVDAEKLVRAVQTDYYRARERAVKLEEALAEAITLIQDWGAYADDYFQHKHDLAGDVARLRALLTQEEGG
ncbi:MAG TPA: hypothetical protein DCQ09_00730 [Alcanivorax sp.]|nr:hypothetical protein [Alcanivorax sp.]